MVKVAEHSVPFVYFKVIMNSLHYHSEAFQSLKS